MYPAEFYGPATPFKVGLVNSGIIDQPRPEPARCASTGGLTLTLTLTLTLSLSLSLSLSLTLTFHPNPDLNPNPNLKQASFYQLSRLQQQLLEEEPAAPAAVRTGTKVRAAEHGQCHQLRAVLGCQPQDHPAVPARGAEGDGRHGKQ